jgi:hypothetical protein
MGSFRFDWRWLALIAVVAILANGRNLPWPITALTMAASGGYLLFIAWRSYSGGRPRQRRDTTRVTYWRGQRIETAGPVRRAPVTDLSSVGPLLVYGLVGLALALAALAVTMRGLGIT